MSEHTSMASSPNSTLTKIEGVWCKYNFDFYYFGERKE